MASRQIGPQEALAALRATSQSSHRKLADVAEDVTAPYGGEPRSRHLGLLPRIARRTTSTRRADASGGHDLLPAPARPRAARPDAPTGPPTPRDLRAPLRAGLPGPGAGPAPGSRAQPPTAGRMASETRPRRCSQRSVNPETSVATVTTRRRSGTTSTSWPPNPTAA